jgi:2-phospho-L-lactate transferase/gluconeogenesis factor (CofD/UPF0052 family)
VIVRIMADNQYRIEDEQTGEITRLDDELLAAVEANNQTQFHAALQRLIEHVQQSGQVVPDEELVPSDLMIPAPDMTLAEAHAVLQKATVAEQKGSA